MRIFDFLRQLTSKFAPLDKQSEVDLDAEASKEYMILVGSAKAKKLHNETSEDKKALTMQEKLIVMLERPYVRYIVAVAFVIAVRAIQNWQNKEEEGKEDEEPEDDYEEFLKWKRKNR